MPKVFILNKGAHDYTPAERFGDLVYCSDGLLNRFDVQQMYRILDPILSKSEYTDYILITSLTTLCSVACAMFAAIHGQLNILIYRDGDYVERTIVLDK